LSVGTGCYALENEKRCFDDSAGGPYNSFSGFVEPHSEDDAPAGARRNFTNEFMKTQDEEGME
jgi:hypothetical protein